MHLPGSISSKVTPAQAVKILQEHGMQVNADQAAAILDFLFKLAKSSQNENSLPIHKSEHRRAS